MRIQRRMFQEALRPELVVTGWARLQRGDGRPPQDIIRCKGLRNVGKGHALHVVINCRNIEDNHPLAFATTTYRPIIAPGDSETIDLDIVLSWAHVRSAGGGQLLPITLSLAFSDARNMRYETKYELAAVPLDGTSYMADAIMPGVSLYHRTTTISAGWRLRAHARLARLRAFATKPLRLPRPHLPFVP